MERSAKRVLCGAITFLLLLSGLAAKTRQSPLYTSLLEHPLYARTGFDPADITRMPNTNSGLWQVIEGPRKTTARIMDFDFGIPKRPFLSLRGSPEREFTYVIPFVLEPEKMAALADSEFIPGMFFSSLGDNWEIYLNGHLIRSEMHLDAEGRIKSHRGWRNLYFPVDKTLFAPGTNLLALRIVGDPNYDCTGFFYGTADYIDDYALIARHHGDFLTIGLLAIYIFMGLYHLFIFAMHRKEKYNLYYGLLSILLGIYFLVRSSFIYYLIPDTGITFRIEFFCVYLIFPLSALFLEYFNTKKIFLATKIYGVFYMVLAVSQLFFSLDYSEDILVVWRATLVVVAPFICVYDIGYLFAKAVREARKQYAGEHIFYSLPALCAKVLFQTPFGNIMIGTMVCAATSVFDFIQFFFRTGNGGISRYGFTVYTVGITLILARRLGGVYKQQERIIARSKKCMNVRLVDWIVTRDRDPGALPSVNTETAVMLTDIRGFTGLSEGMPSQSVTDFLIGLNEVLSKPIFAVEDQGQVAYTDKFMGDAMLNIFASPSAALKTAVELRSQLKLFNANPGAFFKDAPPGMRVEVGAGVAYGPVTFGVMGHSRRLDYTPIGDTVNVASRLESLTKEYRTPILLNDALYQAIDPASFHLRHIDRIRVKGKEHPIDLYEEFSPDEPAMREQKIKLLPRFEELREMYFSGKNWAAATRLAEELIESGDYLPAIYLERMRNISADKELLARWDGVYTFTKK
jgi:class 3 adenylate cyclase